MSYFTYKGKQVYYEEKGEGQLMIFLHGNTASSQMFYEVVKCFKKYHVVLIDFLGHGKSERIEKFEDDFWYDQGQQVLALLNQFPNEKAILIGSSGGAISALNAGLQAPEKFFCIIADSFEGKKPIPALVQGLDKERDNSLIDPASMYFYQAMHGDDYEHIVKQDTEMMMSHFMNIKEFYHKPLSQFCVPTLLTGSEQDEMIIQLGITYESLYKELLENPYMKCHLFESGGHPAILSNVKSCSEVIKAYLKEVSLVQM